MAGATRSSYRKPSVRPAPLSPQGERQASSGTTVVDEHMNVVNGAGGYVTPKTDRSLTHTDLSRLSQDLEPLNLNNENGGRRASPCTTFDEVLPIGEHMNEVISVISKLEGLGLQRLQIPLPKCVVLGEQSTGKSSVIEAISGIQTPRSTDTCTRCPLFIKMEPSSDPHDKWHAQIILRQSYSYDGRNRSKFPGWVPSPNPTDVDFASTDSLSALEDLIARAQLAALCPMSDPMDFLPPAIVPKDPDTHHQTQFSPNVVCIHVSKPDLPALSFYDLPGIIGQSESAADHFVVKFVKDLVMEYIRDPETLILVTCSLENDIANSTAGGIARELKATNRCIGVLTKPDRLPPGSRADRLQAVLDGDRFTLGYGYYVVKNPGQDDIDRGLTHQQARIQERQFFESKEPWATTFQEYQKRFGTRKLQNNLSVTLASQMGTRLPIIRDQVHARLERIEAELNRLPEPPTHNATRIVSDILLSFSSHVRREMEAEYPCRTWRNIWENLHKDFYKGLLSMKPTMATGGQLDKGIFAVATPGKSVDDAYVIDSQDEDEDAPKSESPETPSKKRKVGESIPGLMRPPPSHYQTSSRATPVRTLELKPTLPEADRYVDLRKKFKLDDIARHLRETSKSRLPDQLDPKVVDDLIMATIEHWELPMKRFFEDLKRDLRTTVHGIFNEHFGQWAGSPISNDAWKIVEQLLNSNFTEQEDVMAVESLTDEREGPYVFNEDVFNRERMNTREQYRHARYRARIKVYSQEMRAQTGKEFTPQDEEKLRKDEKRLALLMAEPYEKEVEVIARVTSYYMVAARRFYESVCIRIESKFFKRLRMSLRDDLDNGLGIHDNKAGPQNAINLLAEPSDRFEKRKGLVAMKNALLQGLGMLQELQDKYGDNPSLPSSQATNGGGRNGYTFPPFGPISAPLAEEMEDINRSGMARG